MASSIELLLLAAAVPLLREGASGTWGLDWSQTDTSTHTLGNVANTDTPLSAAWPIAVGNAQAGTIYTIEAPLTGTWGTQVLNLGVQFNGSGITSICPVGTVVVASAGDGVAGVIRLNVQCITTGSGGTVNVWTDGMLVDAAINRGNVPGQASLGGFVAAAAFNTTISNTIAIAAFWPATASGQTIAGRGSTFTRKGP